MKKFEKKDILLLVSLIFFLMILIPVSVLKGFISEYFSFVDRWASSSTNFITKKIASKVKSEYSVSEGDFSLVEFKFVKFSITINSKSVFITGDFNKWQKTELLKKNSLWEIEIPLVKGRYRYLFVVNDKEILDPLNPNIDYYNGKKVSVIEVK
jgi:hypothetical protein